MRSLPPGTGENGEMGVNTARFAPRIMTPTVRMGFSPSVLKVGDLAVQILARSGDRRERRGGSKPPPYGTTAAPFAPSIMTPTVRMGFGPSAGFRIIAVGVNPHRTEQVLLASRPAS